MSGSGAPRWAISATGVVLVKGRREGALIIAVGRAYATNPGGFALQDSNFHMQPGFPVFLGNALSWLTTTEPGAGARPWERSKWRSPARRSAMPTATASPTARTAAGTSFQAPRPGVYSVSGVGGDLQVVANIRDPSARTNQSEPLCERGGRPYIRCVAASSLVRSSLGCCCWCLAPPCSSWNGPTFSRRITV